MRNVHAWKTKTADGDKREVRASKFGKRWKIQAKAKDALQWTYYEEPPMGDLLELREVLWRKYQRKHLSWEDIAAIDRMIEERGGPVPPPEAPDEGKEP